MKLYHNPRCSKSRNSLELLQEKGIQVDIVKYLEETPTKEVLKGLLKKLGIKAEDLVRKGEKEYKAHFKGKSLTEEEWIEAMVQYPKLIERPIFEHGNKAVIGRPPENILKLINPNSKTEGLL